MLNISLPLGYVGLWGDSLDWTGTLGFSVTSGAHTSSVEISDVRSCLHHWVDELLWSQQPGSKCTKKCLKTTCHSALWAASRESKASWVNPEGKMGGWSPEGNLRLLASFSPATTSVPRFIGFCLFLGLHWGIHKGDTQYLPYNSAQCRGYTNVASP